MSKRPTANISFSSTEILEQLRNYAAEGKWTNFSRFVEEACMAHMEGLIAAQDDLSKGIGEMVEAEVRRQLREKKDKRK